MLQDLLEQVLTYRSVLACLRACVRQQGVGLGCPGQPSQLACKPFSLRSPTNHQAARTYILQQPLDLNSLLPLQFHFSFSGQFDPRAGHHDHLTHLSWSLDLWRDVNNNHHHPIARSLANISPSLPICSDIFTGSHVPANINLKADSQLCVPTGPATATGTKHQAPSTKPQGTQAPTPNCTHPKLQPAILHHPPF